MAATDKPYRNPRTLDIVFAVSCVAMLLTTVWMLVQDYHRDFKAVQRSFRDIEATLAEREMIAKMPAADVVSERRRALKSARQQLEEAKAEVAPVERALIARREKADDHFRSIKADYDAKVSYYNIAVDDAGNHPSDSEAARRYQQQAKELRTELTDLEKRMDAAKAELDRIDKEFADKVRSKLEAPEKAFTDAEDALKKVTGTFDRFAKVAAQKDWTVADTIRALPILDGFASPVKINQIWLPELTIDYSFKEVPRYDRCTTCHLGIDRASYDRATLVRMGDEGENRRLTSKLVAAKEMLQKRVDAGEKLGFSPDALPGKTHGSVSLATLLLFAAAVIAALSLGLLERSLRIGVQVLLIGLGIASLSSTALAVFAPRHTAVRTVKLDAGQVTQYAAHPRLDLFVGSNSPHPAEKFGCTVCHAGQGSATDFNLAAHAPTDAVQTEKWHKEHGYQASHFWDFPMLPNRFIESSCLKCHHEITDLIRYGSEQEAPKLTRGYQLVREMGCFGCHEISGARGGRQVGPDLRLEPTPAKELLSAADQARLDADPANPPGDLRKVGPSLRRLAEKTSDAWTVRWLNAPRDFRPDTRMPHFYNLSTNHRDVLPEDQKNFPSAEIHAISHYLLTESKDHLAGRDFYRLALLEGKQNLHQLQKALIATGLEDRDQKELFDVSRRFTDLALLSAPLQAEAINREGIRQRQLQERIAALQRRRQDLEGRGVAGPEMDTVTKQIAAAGQDLTGLTTRLIELARPTPLADRLLNENGQPVTLPAKDGDLANGRRLFTERGCLACHAHQGTTTPHKQGDKTLVHAVASDADFGPELSRIADKLAPTLDKVSARRWLVQWLLNPSVYHPRTRMPVTYLSLAEANDVATWLLSQKTGWQGKPPEPQAPLLQDYVNLARVYLAKAPGVTRTHLDTYLPTDGKPAGIPADKMSGFARDAEERKLVSGQVDEATLKWYVGRKAISRQGCYACHDIPGFETAKPIGVGLNDWGRKDNERIAFEDGAAYAREHFNIVPVRKTRQEVEARIQALEAREEKDRSDTEKSELQKLKEQIEAQKRIVELEQQELTRGLSRSEARELEELRPLKFFEPLAGADGKTKPPLEEFFYHALEHHQREGFLQLKLAEPRSFDHNRIRPWDERLRMPQFRFSRTRQGADEPPAAYAARLEKEEAEAREAVMTFVLGLVATPMPLKYLHRPSDDKKAEILGRQVLEKYNCGSCHHIRPGVFEFKVNEEMTQAMQNSYNTAMTPQKLAEDYPFLNHSAWFGNGGQGSHGDRHHAFGYFNAIQTNGRREAGEQVDVVYLSEALRFVGPDRVVRDLPAGTNLVLPENSYVATRPFGGTWTDLMVPYLSRKNSTDFPEGKPENARSVLPPPLHREGERIQPEWGYRFVLNPDPIRPQETMLLRMPRFNLSKEEARAVINYFAAVSRLTNPGAGVQYPYVPIEQREAEYWQRMNAEYEVRARPVLQKQQEERRKVEEERKQAENERRKLEGELATLKKDLADPKNAKKADELKKNIAGKEAAIKNVADRLAKLPAAPAGGDGAQGNLYARHTFTLLTDKNLCLKCHNIGALKTDKPQAPNLGLAAERLRPDWVERWVAIPERMFIYFPVMPQNFKNIHDPIQWENQDKFIGSPQQQIGAVRDLLMDSPRLNTLISTTPPTPPAAAGGTKK